MSKAEPIPSETIANVAAVAKSPRQVGREFRSLLAAGCTLRADGQAKPDPAVLLSRGYTPKYEIELFGTRFFLCNLRIFHDLKLMPAYVLPARQARRVHARVFYKDSSLVWRVVSHYINTPETQWIGKGTVKWHDKRGETGWASAEESTNLPFEMQAALDEVSHGGPRARQDGKILSLVVRNAPPHRLQAYRDFEAPREKAMQLAANRINGNRPIAWFADDNDPASLEFEAGFEPDFRAVADVSRSRSKMYGGEIGKYRILSRNRRIQFLFLAGPHHVWLVHPQSLTTELSNYGLRTVDVIADEDMCIPGYEFFDNDGSGEVDDQIPTGFAGAVCPFDPDRADASPWNERMPVVQRFRRFTGIARS